MIILSLTFAQLCLQSPQRIGQPWLAIIRDAKETRLVSQLDGPISEQDRKKLLSEFDQIDASGTQLIVSKSLLSNSPSARRSKLIAGLASTLNPGVRQLRLSQVPSESQQAIRDFIGSLQDPNLASLAAQGDFAFSIGTSTTAFLSDGSRTRQLTLGQSPMSGNTIVNIASVREDSKHIKPPAAPSDLSYSLPVPPQFVVVAGVRFGLQPNARQNVLQCMSKWLNACTEIDSRARRQREDLLHKLNFESKYSVGPVDSSDANVLSALKGEGGFANEGDAKTFAGQAIITSVTSNISIQIAVNVSGIVTNYTFNLS